MIKRPNAARNWRAVVIPETVMSVRVGLAGFRRQMVRPKGPPSTEVAPSVTRAGAHLQALVAVMTLLIASGCSQLLEIGGGPAKRLDQATVPARPTTPARATLPVAAADAEVITTQEALSELGYYSGSIDGIAGPMTRTAIARYQTDQGLMPDGKVSRALLDRLAMAPSPSGKIDALGRAGNSIYEPGDTYVYTGGRVETILSVQGDRVRWRNAIGSQWVTDQDSPVPATEVAGAQVGAMPEFVWPLRIGSAVTYSIRTGNPVRGVATEDWRCVVEDRTWVSVPAGRFDSFKIGCRPRADVPGPARSKTWYYAPSVGNYVRFIDAAATPEGASAAGRSRDLVAVRAGTRGWPSEARIGLDWALTHALEREPAGSRVPWESTAVADRIIIEPAGYVDIGHAGSCRQFKEMRIAPDGRQRTYPGVACRTVTGRWTIHGIEGAILAAQGTVAVSPEQQAKADGESADWRMRPRGAWRVVAKSGAAW